MTQYGDSTVTVVVVHGAWADARAGTRSHNRCKHRDYMSLLLPFHSPPSAMMSGRLSVYWSAPADPLW
jgi:hypothetical protein